MADKSELKFEVVKVEASFISIWLLIKINKIH